MSQWLTRPERDGAYWVWFPDEQNMRLLRFEFHAGDAIPYVDEFGNDMPRYLGDSCFDGCLWLPILQPPPPYLTRIDRNPDIFVSVTPSPYPSKNQ